MGFIDSIDIYTPENAIPVVTSMFLFIMYTVITLMDANEYIKELGIGDNVISTGKFIYTYIAGYFTYILKTTVSMISIWVLLSIVRVALVVIFNIFRPVALGGAGAADFSKSMSGKIGTALKNNALWILGFFMINKFLVTFLAYGPIFVLLITFAYGIRIYNYETLRRQEKDGETEPALRALMTTHHHMMITLSLFVIMLIGYLAMLYINTFNIVNPDFADATTGLPVKF
jgi:hypothetical protein